MIWYTSCNTFVNFKVQPNYFYKNDNWIKITDDRVVLHMYSPNVTTCATVLKNICAKKVKYNALSQMSEKDMKRVAKKIALANYWHDALKTRPINYNIIFSYYSNRVGFLAILDDYDSCKTLINKPEWI